MSEEITESEMALIALLQRFTKFLWAFGIAMFAIGSWGATQEIRLYFNERADEKSHAEIEHVADWMIKVDNTRYTMQDRQADQAREAEEKLLSEKRLQRLEDNQVRFTETLNKLNATLNKL